MLLNWSGTFCVKKLTDIPNSTDNYFINESRESRKPYTSLPKSYNFVIITSIAVKRIDTSHFITDNFNRNQMGRLLSLNVNGIDT